MLHTSILEVERLCYRQATSPTVKFAASGRGSLRVPLFNRQSYEEQFESGRLMY